MGLPVRSLGGGNYDMQSILYNKHPPPAHTHDPSESEIRKSVDPSTTLIRKLSL